MPLTQAWGRGGEAAVVISVLENAGFHPAIECDPRGPMHFYGWPFGSSRQITVWVPEAERDDALEFLATDCEPAWDDFVDDGTFAGLTLAYRRWMYLAWLFNVVQPAALLVGAKALVNSVDGDADSDDHRHT